MLESLFSIVIKSMEKDIYRIYMNVLLLVRCGVAQAGLEMKMWDNTIRDEDENVL